MSRRKNRTKHFGDVVVAVERENGHDTGSVLIHGDARYSLPHWPARIQSVEAREDGLNVLFTNGGQRFLDRQYDAVMSEADAAEFTITQLGKLRYLVRTFDRWGSIEALEGLPEPANLHEWLREQAQSAHKWNLEEREIGQAVREKLAKKGTGHALPHGGYPIEQPIDLKNAIRAIGRAKDRSATIAHIKKAAKRLNMTKLLPSKWGAVTEAQLDALVERVRKQTRIEPAALLAEIVEAANVPDGLTIAGQADPDGDGDGGSDNCGTCQYFEAIGSDPDGDGDTVGNCQLYDWPVDDTLVCTSYTEGDGSQGQQGQGQQQNAPVSVPAIEGDVFEEIFVQECAALESAVAACVEMVEDTLAQRDASYYGPLMEYWLALHGDSGKVREDPATIEEALDRARSGIAEAKPRVRSALDGRVAEVMRGVYEYGEYRPLRIAESTRRTETLDIFADDFDPMPQPHRPDPLADRHEERATVTSIREAAADAPDEALDVDELAHRPLDELQEQAYDLYEASGGATPEGRRRIGASSSIELARMIRDLHEDERLEVLEELSAYQIHGYHHLGTDGKPRDISRMNEEKVRHFAHAKESHPELKKRARAELKKRGLPLGKPVLLTSRSAKAATPRKLYGSEKMSKSGKRKPKGLKSSEVIEPIGGEVLTEAKTHPAARHLEHPRHGKGKDFSRRPGGGISIQWADGHQTNHPHMADAVRKYGITEAALSVGTAHAGTGPGSDKRGDTTDDTRLDALLAAGGESFRRFEAALQKRATAGPVPTSTGAAQTVVQDDGPVPRPWSDYRLRGPAAYTAYEAALEAGRAVLTKQRPQPQVADPAAYEAAMEAARAVLHA